MVDSSARHAAADSLAEPLGRFVVAFVRAIRTLQLYPADHPFAHDGIEQFRDELASLIGDREEITLAFEGDDVLVEDRVVLRAHGSVAPLRRYLDEKGISAFTVGRDVDAAELRRLAEVLASYDDDVVRDGRLAPSVASSFRSIRIDEVSYRRVDRGGAATAGAAGAGNTAFGAAPAPAAAATGPFGRFDEGNAESLRHIEEMLGTNAASLGDGWLARMREVLPGFDRSDGDVVDAVLERLERLVLALLERARLDPGTLAATLDSMLTPLAPSVANDGLKKFFEEEHVAPRDGRWIRRLSVAARAEFLLRLALRHAPLVDPVRRAWNALDPDGSDNLLGAALRRVEEADWPRVQTDRATRVLTALDPIDRREDRSTPAPRAPAAEPSGPPLDARPTAIVCDADPRAASSLVRILEREGFEVDGFQDGELALDAILALRPSLVVMDPMLPGIHGLEILARLKRIRPAIPVMVTSRHTAFDEEYAVTTYARRAIVRKPIDVEKVREALGVLAVGRAGTPSVVGPGELFGDAPASGPTIGVLRCGPFEVAVGVRGAMRHSFFRLVPVDQWRTAILVAERESGDVDSSAPFRELDLWLRHTGARASWPPHEILERANDRVRRCREPALLSALALVADSETNSIAVSRAGYPAPLVALPGGAAAEMLLPFGPLIGLSATSSGRTRPLTTRIPVPKGSLVLLHSGGVLDAIAPGAPLQAIEILCRFAASSVDQSASDAMAALFSLLGGLGVKGPGPDLNVLLFRDAS